MAKQAISKLKRSRLAQAKRTAAKVLYELEHVRYKIVYQYREGYGDWRKTTRYASPGILFRTYEKADEYLQQTAFKNFTHRKMSASISKVII